MCPIDFPQLIYYVSGNIMNIDGTMVGNEGKPLKAVRYGLCGGSAVTHANTNGGQLYWTGIMSKGDHACDIDIKGVFALFSTSLKQLQNDDSARYQLLMVNTHYAVTMNARSTPQNHSGEHGGADGGYHGRERWNGGTAVEASI
ncbi:hypothetical protein Tco_1530333 [Tanacetum coccineum]